MAVEQIAAFAGVLAALLAFFGIISMAMRRRILSALSFGTAVAVAFYFLLLPLFAT